MPVDKPFITNWDKNTLTQSYVIDLKGDKNMGEYGK